MMPPLRKLIRFGLMLDRSYAADTKFATMFTPMVASTKTPLPNNMMMSLSTRSSRRSRS